MENKQNVCSHCGAVTIETGITDLQVVVIPLYNEDGSKNVIDLTDDEQMKKIIAEYNADAKSYVLPPPPPPDRIIIEGKSPEKPPNYESRS